MSHGLVPSPVKLSEWRSLHSFQRLAFSNGGMVDLSHERYLQWQQHKAQGTKKTSDASETLLSTGLK